MSICSKNKITLLLLFLYIAAGIKAQYQNTSYTLSTDESGATKNYVARDYITMKPGFRYAPSGSKNFTAKIDPALIFPPANNYKTPGGEITTNPSQGGVVGSIPGQFAVSPTGAATYTIPIECPKGINGMQPNISLVYNSQGGNGIAGYGWSIGGLSKITRACPDILREGYSSTLKYNSYGPFSLDGVRLLYSGPDLLFTLENNPRIRISVESDGFELQGQNGKIFYYGKSSGALFAGNDTVLSYNLDYVKDINGNSIKYTYNKDNNYNYIKEIEYGSNENKETDFCHYIKFEYENRPDTIKSAIGKFTSVIAKRLSSIKVGIGETVLRTYNIIYSEDRYSRIQKVELKSIDGISVNPTEVFWNTYPKDNRISSNNIDIYVSSHVASNCSDLSYINAASSCEGNDAVIGFNSKKGKLFVSSYYPLLDKEGRLAFYGDGKELLTEMSHNGILSYIKNPLIGNVLGNCDNEMLLPHFYEDKSHSMALFYVMSGTYVEDTLWIGVLRSFDKDHEPICALSDMNNDGLCELLVLEKIEKGIANNYGFHYLSTRENRWKSLPFELSEEPQEILTGDFNSDGMTDILVLGKNGYKLFFNSGESEGSNHVLSFKSKSGSEFNSDYSTVQIGDFNGDGHPDLILNDKGSSLWQIAINKGDGSFSLKELNGINAKDNSDHYKCIVLNFNKDKKSDIFISSNDSIYLDISGKIIKYRANTSNAKNVLAGDYNRDGIDEVLNYGRNLIDRNDTRVRWRYYSVPDFIFASGLVNKIVNGLGVETEFSYQMLGDGLRSIYREISIEKATYPVLYCAPKIPLTKSVRIYSGDEDIQKLEYKYADARIHMQGRGFLGFCEIRIFDSIQHKWQKTWNFYDKQVYYPFLKTKEVFSGGETDGKYLYTEAYENAVECLGGGLFSPRIKSKTEKTYFYKDNSWSNSYIQQKTEYLDYDYYGDPLKIKTTKDRLVKTKTISYGRHGSWYKNKPEKIRVVTTYNGFTDTRSTEYGYDDVGNLVSEITDPGDENQVKTEYEDLDVFGNVKTIKVTANNATRCKLISYTNSGRFVKSKTNELGETTSYDWDERRGLLSSETTRVGTTNYLYDSFGQLVEAHYPDGIRATECLRWAADNNCGAKYYKYNECSGTAPVCIWYDSFGREVKRETKGLNDKSIRIFIKYDSKGKVKQVSEPTFETTAQGWAIEYTYDEFGRKKTVTKPNGVTTITYDGTKVTTISPKDTVIEDLYKNGFKEYTETNGKKIEYTYYPNAKIYTIWPDNISNVSIEYDKQGNRKKLNNPGVGAVIESKYNGFGELLWNRQAIHKKNTVITTTNNYDPATGLIQTIDRNGEVTSYNYDSDNRVKSIEIAGKNKETYTYDDFDRVTKMVVTIDGTKQYTYRTVYDALGRVKKKIYPSGYYIINIYDNNGNLVEVKDSGDRSLYKAEDANSFGQLTKVKHGDKEIIYKYDSRHMPYLMKSSGIIDYTYSFDKKGDLSYRNDNINGQKELFSYDYMDRLTDWDIYQNGQEVKDNYQKYDEFGSISSRSDLNNIEINYGENGPDYAITSISGEPENIPHDSLVIEYTDFKKIKTLKEGPKLYTISYGVDDQRRKSVYKEGGEVKQTKYYLGDYEEEISENGNTRKIHYINGGDGLTAILIKNNGKDSLLYAYTDYQGSLISLADKDGNVVERYAYDPWGNRRNPEDWTEKDSRKNWVTNRGYTMHEHVDAFDIINMNGRVYDPLTAMFFSPDPYVQAPDDWRNYNRYAYCLNNPLLYTDPSGEVFGIDDAIFATVIYFTTMNVVSNWDDISQNGGLFSSKFWSYAGYGALNGVGVATGNLWVMSATAIAQGLGNGYIDDGHISKKEIEEAAVDGLTTWGMGKLTLPNKGKSSFKLKYSSKNLNLTGKMKEFLVSKNIGDSFSSFLSTQIFNYPATFISSTFKSTVINHHSLKTGIRIGFGDANIQLVISGAQESFNYGFENISEKIDFNFKFSFKFGDKSWENKFNFKWLQNGTGGGQMLHLPENSQDNRFLPVIRNEKY